jgi:hypothetical protein
MRVIGVAGAAGRAMRRSAAACAALVVVAAVLAAGCAHADEVPYVQSPGSVVDAMLTLARVGPQDFVVDLGSGDGRIVIAAARGYGARGLGIDYDRTLVAESRENARRAGVADRVEFHEQDIFDTDFSQATVLTMYLLPEVNFKLRPRVLLELRPGTRVVSHDFDMADWEPDGHLTVAAPDKTVGPTKESNLFLWVVPARVAGHWRGTLTGPQGEEPALIEFHQTFQKTSASVWLRHASLSGSGRIAGERILLPLAGPLSASPTGLWFTLRAVEDRLEGEAVDGERRYVLKATRIRN